MGFEIWIYFGKIIFRKKNLPTWIDIQKMFRNLKKRVLWKIIDYQLLQKKLWALKFENYWTKKVSNKRKMSSSKWIKSSENV